jgi:hypothetical protein
MAKPRTTDPDLAATSSRCRPQRTLLAALFADGEHCFPLTEFDDDGDAIAAFPRDGSYRDEPGVQLIIDADVPRKVVLRVLEKFSKLLAGKQGGKLLQLEKSSVASRLPNGGVEFTSMSDDDDDELVYMEWTP